MGKPEQLNGIIQMVDVVVTQPTTQQFQLIAEHDNGVLSRRHNSATWGEEAHHTVVRQLTVSDVAPLL